MAKERKNIKIIPESDINYTFLDSGSTNLKPETKDADANSNDSNIFKKRFIDSKKSKIQYRNRITGGQNQQGHSSVYE